MTDPKEPTAQEVLDAYDGPRSPLVGAMLQGWPTIRRALSLAVVVESVPVETLRRMANRADHHDKCGGGEDCACYVTDFLRSLARVARGQHD